MQNAPRLKRPRRLPVNRAVLHGFFPLPPSKRHRLRPLVQDWPYLPAVVEAILGGMGEVLTDNPLRPRVAVLRCYFRFIAGDPTARSAKRLPRLLPRYADMIVPSPQWSDRLRQLFGKTIAPYRRFSFRENAFDRNLLKNYQERLPLGFSIKRIDAGNIASFHALAQSLVMNFGSHQQFLAEGLGYGVEYEGQMVAGASSFAMSDRQCEIEIDTHHAFRRRGLAAAAAARLIEHCLDAGLEPRWDAANYASAGLAEKLGFTSPRGYRAYLRQHFHFFNEPTRDRLWWQ